MAAENGARTRRIPDEDAVSTLLVFTVVLALAATGAVWFGRQRFLPGVVLSVAVLSGAFRLMADRLHGRETLRFEAVTVERLTVVVVSQLLIAVTVYLFFGILITRFQVVVMGAAVLTFVVGYITAHTTINGGVI